MAPQAPAGACDANWVPGGGVQGQTAAGLLAAQPSVQAPLIGYHIVGGYYPSSALTSGSTLTTTDYVQGTDGQQELLTLSIGSRGQVGS